MNRDWKWVALAGLALLASGCGGGDSGPARSSSAASSSAPDPSAGDAEAADAPEPAATGGEASPDSAGEMKSDSDAESPPAGEGDASSADSGDAKEKSLENLKTIGSAMQAYDEQYKHFPPAAVCDASGKPLLSWRVALLPLLGEEELYKEFHQDEPWDSEHNKELAKRMPSIYRTPGGLAPPKTCYLVPLREGSAISLRESMSGRDMLKTKSTTALVVEVNREAAVTWTQPQDWQFVPANPALGLGKLRDGEFCCTLANGKSRTYPKDLGAEVLRALFNAKAKKPAELEPEEAQAADDSPEAKSEEGLLAQAKASLAEGHELQGLAYLMAEAVVRGDGEVLDTLRWSPALRMPMLTTRWGIAVQLPPANKAIRRRQRSEDAPADQDGAEGDPVRFWRDTLIQPLVQQLQLRVTGGQFGQWLKENQQATGDSSETETRWPGILLFNAATQAEATQRAEKEKLDLLLIAEITQKPVARGLPQTVLVLHLLDTVKGTELWPAKNKKLHATLNSTTVRMAKETGRGGDPVKETIDELMSFIDQNLQLAEIKLIDGKLQLPGAREISRERALDRAKNLVAQKSPNPLPILMELRYYQRKQLLTPEEIAAHYSTLLDQEEGPRLAGGTEADRLQVIGRFLPKQPKETQ